ncbi:hypothetical protein CRG98_011097 [Punica granatum]|uniref:Uncharacterized protein n=1 Tax=Punica granatum TaxID=22663 RepID=A0A2I0KJ41_PUNGR|nr:hypothetical protein CRG98_011097 [Punica granatum]
MDAPAPLTLHTSVAQPFTSPYSPPPAPTAVTLPPAAFLTSDQVLSAPPPISMPAPTAAYTVPPPTVFLTSGAPAPIHFQTTEFPPYSSLQPHADLSYPTPPPINTTFHELGTPTHAAQFASPTHFFPEADADQERRLKRMEETIRALQANDARPDTRYGDYSLFPGIYYSQLLAHTSSFSDLIEAGKKLDLGIKLGRMEGPTDKREEPSKKATSQGPQVGTSQHRPRRQYTPLPAPLYHIYRQLLAGNQIQSISPGLNFDPSVQDQSKHCKYHQGAPGHTLDNCWRLRDEIQRRIDSNRLTFNAVRPPNMQANPLPDHRPSSGPSINMISMCVSERDEEAQENPLPFVINYTPEELTVGFTGHVASPASFVVDISAREPYSYSKVPWTYEGSVGSVEQQFNVMGVTRSGRVYESSAAKDKGKAPVVEDGATPESSPFPPKKVTEEEAEAFMKIVKASEYKVVEQMAKSPAHISLLALLLGSEPHREAVLRVLTSAQVPKETPPDMIEETVGSIFSNTISFLDDELPSEGWSHSQALHIVCKCNNYIIGRVMIDNGSALNVCSVTTLKQMNVNLNRVRPSKTTVRAFDGSRREVNGEIDLLIDVGPCSFSITF